MKDEKLDYKKIGLKCGLEIHQQLDTKKLFCNCPGVLRNDKPDFIIKRKLHAVAGESGEIDSAAKHEAERNRNFIYEGYGDNCCLVDYDESPPRLINTEALKIVLQIAIMLNCKIFPVSQIMRKTVIDGSNTSGFQRTVLIAHSGFIETPHGKVEIDSVCLEEDSARIINRENDVATYRLDRLGIPLIEIATAPDITSPEQAREVALHLGDILRSCRVKRGIGTIRQDVNVSVKEGSRVEIKGFQDPSMIVKTIDSEIKRQQKLIGEGKEVISDVRNALISGETKFLRPMPGSARMYPETDLPLLRVSRGFINDVKKNLPKLRSEIEKELMKDGLSQDMIKLLFKQSKLLEFRELLEIVNNPKLVAKILLVFPKEIAGKEKKDLKEIYDKLEDNFSSILQLVKKGKISESHIKQVLERLICGKNFKDAIKFEKVNLSDAEEKIMKIIKGKPGLNPNAYMGLVMKEFKGKISGKEAMEMIQKFIS